jgi:hypothetical protein
MQKSKGKPSKPVNRLTFALLWAGSLAVTGWLLNNLTLAMIQYLRLNTQQMEIIPYFLGTMVLALVQVLVTERVLKRSMCNWLVYTLVGGLCVLLWSHRFPMISRWPLVELLSGVSWLWLPVFQTMWLWRRVRYAWLWPVAHLALSQMMRLLPPFPGPLHLPVIMLYSFPQQFVMGLVMYFLWSHIKESEKAKVDVASTTHEDAARIERLQDAERHDDVWEHQDSRALHNEV